MKICHECGASYNFEKCSVCSCKVEIINGFLAFSPKLAMQNDGFDPKAHACLSEIEEGNFWFESRNMLIFWAIQRYFPQITTFCEVGCGTGFVLSGMADTFPNVQLNGSEIYSKILSFTQERVPKATLFQADICKFPYEDEFELIGAFDVLEHIEDDNIALKNIHNALKSRGGIILTVPHHKWLWSVHDEAAFHKRRYSKKELLHKVEDAGFQVLKVSSFVSLLLPLMIFSRVCLKRVKNGSMDEEFKLSPILNKLFFDLSSFERKLIKSGYNLPFGSSLLVAGQKK